MSEPVETPPAPDDLPVPQAEPPIDPVPGRDPATLPLDAAQEGLMTGSDSGSPGERAPVGPGDDVTAAVQDDAPLPSGQDVVDDDGAATRDDLTVRFAEPSD